MDLATPSVAATPVTPAPIQTPAEVAFVPSTLAEKLQDGLERVLQRLNADEIADLSLTIERTHSVPMVHDRRVLASCRTSLGRDLSMEEKKLMRFMLQTALKR